MKDELEYKVVCGFTDQCVLIHGNGAPLSSIIHFNKDLSPGMCTCGNCSQLVPNISNKKLNDTLPRTYMKYDLGCHF